MEGKRFIRTIRLKNILSYGSESEEIEFQPLNVLIGPNASGKSNLIEVISLLQATPRDLPRSIRLGGGIAEWLWKGEKDIPVAEIEVDWVYHHPKPFKSWGSKLLLYRICFTMVGQKFELVDEAIEGNPQKHELDFHYRYRNGQPILKIQVRDPLDTGITSYEQSLRQEDLIPNQSILSQIKGPVPYPGPAPYPELTDLGYRFSNIRLYREWNLGRGTTPRRPGQTDQPNDFLEEDASNLALVLNNLQNQPRIRRLLIERLQKLYAAAEDITTKIEGGTIQIFIHEEGLNQPIPATRLSDGTLRYLCLLTILCHPNPPPLICIEEPELGLHPDILPTIAELLVEVSQRTQLIVTTHSDILISALPPESVLVCERDDQGSHLRHLDPERLKKWLETYSLGDLWRMGEIGGNRW